MSNATHSRFALMAPLVISLVVGACSSGEPAASDAVAGIGPVETVEPAAGDFVLPVSHNDVMVALVNHAADPIWVAAWHQPEDEADWRELERLATQLQLAGALLTIPGTGPVDQQWVRQPGWVDWSEQLRDAGAGALAAAEARDVEAISTAGDRIVEVCEGCHMDFKPDLPTGGKFGELSPTAADLEDQE